MSLMMISMLVVRFARSEASAARIQEVLDSSRICPAAGCAGRVRTPGPPGVRECEL